MGGLLGGGFAAFVRSHAMARTRSIQMAGIKARRTGVPLGSADLYYAVMGMSWPAFVVLVTLVFLAVNLAFGSVYAAMPGAVANVRRGSLIDGVFFSVDTLSTVGYGYQYPATHLAHAVASLEVLTGLFFSATVTGLIFARFSLPQVGVAFSSCAVIGRHEGERALMLRVASTRSHPLASVNAQLSWLETVHDQDGAPVRRITNLDLVNGQSPVLGLTWTLIHLLSEDSKLLAALDGDGPFMLSVVLNGVDMLLDTASIGTRTYFRQDVRKDHQFVEMLTDTDDTFLLDMRLLNETRPLPPGAGVGDAVVVSASAPAAPSPTPAADGSAATP